MKWVLSGGGGGAVKGWVLGLSLAFLVVAGIDSIDFVFLNI